MKGRRFRRVVAAGAAVAILVGLAWAWIASLDANAWRDDLALQLSELLGHPVRIEGSLSLDIDMTPAVAVSDIVIDDADDPGGRELARIGRLEVEVSLSHLMEGRIGLRRLRVAGGRVIVHTRDEPSARVERRRPGPVLLLEHLTVSDLEIIDQDDLCPSVTPWHVEHLALDRNAERGDEMRVRARGDRAGIPFDLTGRLDPLERLSGESGSWEFELEGEAAGAQVKAMGEVGSTAEVGDVEVSIEARAGNLQALSPLADEPVSNLGPVVLTGRVSDAGVPRFAFEDLSLEIGPSTAGMARVSGRIANLPCGQGLAFDGELRIEGTESVGPWVSTDVPALGPIAARFRIAGEAAGPLAVERLDVRLGAGDPVELHLEGSSGDLTTLVDGEVRASLRVRDLEKLGERLDRQLPALQDVDLEVRARVDPDADDETARGLALEVDGTVSGAAVTARGRLDDPLHSSGLEAHVTVSAPSVHAFAPLVPENAPDVGRVTGTARVSDESGTTAVEFRVGAERENLFRVQVGGDIPDVTDPGAIALRTMLRARDLSVLGGLFGRRLPEVGPVEFEGVIEGSEARLGVEEMRLDLGRTQLSGRGSLSKGESGRPRLELDVSSPELWLEELTRAAWPSPDAPQEEPSAPTPRVFDERPIRFEMLQKLDARVHARAARVVGAYDLAVEGMEVRLALTDGTLTLERFDGAWPTGEISARGRVDAARSPPEIELSATVEGAQLERVLGLFLDRPPGDGRTNIVLDVHSRGATRRALASNLGGHAGAWLRDGNVDPRLMLQVQDVVAAIFSPDWEPTPTDIRCLAADFRADAGEISIDRLYVDTEEILLRVHGNIDLGDETLEMGLRPKPNRPGIVVTPINYGGPLRSPELAPASVDMATRAAQDLVEDAKRAGRRIGSWISGRPRDGDLCSKLAEEWQAMVSDRS